jgi:gentisate 1,2-dioxygenase
MGIEILTDASQSRRNAMSAGLAVAQSSRGEIATLDALYEEAARIGLTPGWVPRPKPILWAQPKSEFAPAHWRWQDARTALNAAGRLIDVALAERRNLVMRNPAGGANFETARTLVCAYQMILPGEQAPSHRHSSHALRVIIDGKGSFSTVNGEKMPMETGDVVLTPGWCWHGHGHDGSDPAYWFDGLDVPLTHLLEPMFYEEHPDRHARVERLVTTSPFRFTRAAIARELDGAKPDPRGLPWAAHQPGGTRHAADGPGHGAAGGGQQDAPLPLDRQQRIPGHRGRGRIRDRRAALSVAAGRHGGGAELDRHRASRHIRQHVVHAHR